MLLRRAGMCRALVFAALVASGCADTGDDNPDQKPKGCDVTPSKGSVPSHSSASAGVERVTYREQVRDAEVVLVGAVKSSSVKSMRGATDFAFPLRTTTFAVDCLLRGHKGTSKQQIEVTEIGGEDDVVGLTEGGTYLIFAEHRTLLGEYRRLVPMGAAQGIYPINQRGQAFNEPNGRHDFSKVVRDVEER